MALGKNVRALRLARGWELEDLSKRSGVKVGTISAIELRNSVRSQFAPQLAEAFGIPLERLIADTEPLELTTGEGEMLPMKGPGASNVVPVTTGAAKTEALLTELQAIVDGLAPILQEPGRDALVKWAQGQATLQATAATLQAYEQASKALPQAPAAVSETPIRKPSTHD